MIYLFVQAAHAPRGRVLKPSEREHPKFSLKTQLFGPHDTSAPQRATRTLPTLIHAGNDV